MAKQRLTKLITDWSVFLCLIRYLKHTAEGCQEEPSGVHRFGTTCQYMCHCTNNTGCNVDTGTCTNGCASGWYGHACQFADLAYNQHSKHTSNMPYPNRKYANLAMDGDVTTCSHTNNASASTSEPMWKVWLPHQRTIKELTILTTDDGKEYFDKFEVNVENTPEDKKEDASYIPPNSQVCYKQEGKLTDSKEIHVVCEQPLVGNQVRIRLNTIKSQLILCDVRINGGRNLAFRKNVTTNKKQNEIMYQPENAVDGSLRNSSWDYCFVSADHIPIWFYVDFGAMVTISYIHLIEYNYNRIINYKMQKSFDNITWSLVHDDNGKDPPTVDIFLNVDTRWIRIYRENDIRTIICELRAFGDCASGYCGFDCSLQCHCKTTGDRLTGICTSGCEGRWIGTNATCVTECDMDKWDVDCSKLCGSCLNSEPCDVATGICSSGCAHGYKQTNLCNTECVDGTYGPDCMYNCSENCQNGDCLKSNGTCINGCLPGFIGDKCDSECQKGIHGMNCQENCSGNCFNNQYCHHINGTCLSGCKPGWKEDRCNQECDAGTWGLRCIDACGNCLKSSCRTTDGVCEDGCAAGFKVTDLCVEECDIGTYGFECSNECNQNCKSPCNNVNGYCSLCVSGWKGSQCDIECSDTEWGESCRHKCGMCAIGRCDIHNGSCSNGCRPGYYDTDMCLDVIIDDMKAVPTIAIAGSVSGLVVLIAVVLVVLIVIIRRRKQNVRSDILTEITLQDDIIDGPIMEKTTTYETIDTENREQPEEEYIYDELEMETNIVYYNTALSTHQTSSLNVKLSDLSTYVKQGLSNSTFLAQFKEIPHGLQKIFETNAARSLDNSSKNMYTDIYPYDHCRVILKQPKAGPSNDYINASHIKGYHGENEYIAAQGPTHTHLNEFWRMIWEKEIHVIVMVTNLEEDRKIMCIQYWAALKESVQYGDINIFTESENMHADYSVRRFKVYLRGTSLTRDVIHFAYTSWPDKGLPNTTSSLLHFWRRVRKIDPNKTYPWLVHCSNGVGRTGTFISLDFLYDQGQETGQVNVFQCVKDLRNQRVNMVQSKTVPVDIHALLGRSTRHPYTAYCPQTSLKGQALELLFLGFTPKMRISLVKPSITEKSKKNEQYYYLHMIVLDTLVLPSQPVTVDEFERQYKTQIKIDTVSGNQRLKLDYQTFTDAPVVVYDGTWFEDWDVTKDKRLYETEYKNKDKDRFPNILAQDEYRPRLGTSVAGTSTYINAIYIPGYCDSHGFVITQTPLPNTAIDHCRLIVEQEVQVIVTFDEEIETGNVGKYLPDTGTVVLGPFRVSVASEENKYGYIMRKHTLSYNSKVYHLTQFIYKKWAPSSVCPDDPYQMLDFLYNLDSLQRLKKNKPLIVQCMNGAARSGLIVALMNILEYVRIDGEVSIPHVIRCLQARRQQIIPNYEQYKFCHDVLLCYVRRESKHANFN